MKEKLNPGAEIWIVERDENGAVCEVSGYMFVAEVAGFVIASAYINGAKDINSTMAYHAETTVDIYSSNLAVFPAKDCWTTKEAAHNAFDKEEKKTTESEAN